MRGGAEIIQLREKSATSLDFYESAFEAVQVAHRHGVRIIINDRVDIAKAVSADGVHLGQDDLPPENARDLLGEDAIIGFSTHSVEQAVAAKESPVDYIAIGPIFGTRTKDRPDLEIGVEGLRAVRDAIGTFPLVAIGGINVSNVSDVLGAGADSAAIIEAVIGDPSNIAEKMQVLIELSHLLD